jgi:uncharacterized cupin superfamily protein
MKRRHANVINLEEADTKEMVVGKHFGSSMKSLGWAAGGAQLGCTWYELKPGRAAFPKHFHCANEEAIFVLEGDATLRIGDDEVAVRAGDYIALPVGPATAHQMVNRGDKTCRYLCFSTKHTTEVVGYPDSKKIAASAADSPNAWVTGNFWVRELHFSKDQVQYYDGENTGD